MRLIGTAEAVPFPVAATPPSTLDPEHCVAIFRFKSESQLHLNLLCAADKVEDLLGLLLQAFQFARKSRQRLVERDEFVPVLLQKLASGVKRKAPFSGGQERKE